MLHNEKGRIWYGLHFYPGVAEYREAGKPPYRVFLNESTLRKMDPTFAGRPVFVLHSEDELKGKSVEELRSMAEGWVIESFFNQSDGKHWAKFITVSTEADRKLEQGWTLSNAYFWKDSAHGGQWNGVDYEREILNGEFEHLAIVPNPRYEESMVLTPEQFKTYNEEKLLELKKLQNNKNKEPRPMKFKIFKKEKVENRQDVEDFVVQLPGCKREMTIGEVVETLDGLLVKNADKPLDQMQIKVGTESMTVGALKTKFEEVQAAFEELKAENAKDEEECENEDDMDDDDDIVVENEDDEEDAAALKAAEEAEEKKKNKNKKKNSKATVEEQKKKQKDKEKADKLRNANKRTDNDLEEPTGGTEFMDSVERGKKRYGS